MAKASFTKNLLISALFWAGIALLGSLATSGGMAWYKGLTLPEFTPAGGVIGGVWTVIFTLAAVSFAIALSSRGSHPKRRAIITSYVINGLLNVLWSVLFFGLHRIGFAFAEAIILGISTIAIIVIVRPISKPAAALLFPYVAWVAFASYLTFSIWKINP